MNINWDKTHTKILNDFFNELNENKIKYFVIRNFERLPEINDSKDVDIFIEPSEIMVAKKLLYDIYKQNQIEYYYKDVYSDVSCCYGISLSKKISIHIDLITSYSSKGYEVLSFNEIYKFIKPYKNFYVIDEYFQGVILFIFKQFNYSNPKLKREYREIIFNTNKNYKDFSILLEELLGKQLSDKIIDKINDKDFDGMLGYSQELTKQLKKYVLKKRPLTTLYKIVSFIFEKITINTIKFRKLSKVFAVMAPDGAGKTTFLDNLSEKLAYYFINSSINERVSIYHFRPSILPNLSAVGEKAKVMKQDTDYSNPHRAKPAGKLSSLVRITYYWLDYVIGYFILTRKDLKTYKFTLFDRYIYDFIVDPFRSRINLPTWVRKFYVKLTPQPKIVFYLHADPDVIFKRKQELTLEEIKRQNEIYLDLAKSNKRFKILDANRHYDESVDEALEIILDTFCEKL